MIQPVGSIVELVFVTHDAEKSARRWTHDLRAGPFYLGEYTIPYLYKGVERPVQLKFAGGYTGSMLIELVQPDDEPSVFRDHLNERAHEHAEVGIVVHDEDALGGGWHGCAQCKSLHSARVMTLLHARDDAYSPPEPR